MGGGWWSDKTKVILNSTQFKLKLKLELSLAKMKTLTLRKIPNTVEGNIDRISSLVIFNLYLV